MKVILFGSTGFIGKKVLRKCLENPNITSVIALSRRNLPEEATNPKLTVVIIENFKIYHESALRQLKGADACIWSIGTYNGDTEVELEYPEAFQNALLKVSDINNEFRYVYLGGAFTELDQERTLWLFSKARRVRGLAQTKLLGFGQQNAYIMTYIVRPGGVVAGDGSTLFESLIPIISVGRLAAVMVDLAVNGGSDQVLDNKGIKERGRKL